MRLIVGQDALVAQFVALHIPHLDSGEDFGPCTALGVEDQSGALVGGIVYHNYTPAYGNIELSFAGTSQRWLTRSILCAFLSYPFEQLNCQRVTGCTPRKAASARRFLDQFGFKREGCVRLGFGDDHMIISGLLASEWRASKWAKPLPQRRAQRAGRDDHRQEESSDAGRA